MVNLSRRKLFSRNSDPSLQQLPWAKLGDEFYDKCSRCNDCIQACETQIITKGTAGFPKVDFKLGECTFCYQCADVCKEPIFEPQSTRPWQNVIDITVSCLALQKVTCRSCEDVCEPMAITFKAVLGGPAQPKVDLDLCNGCGACVNPCPTNSINMILGVSSGN
ncbi:MAG: ferredoxin-type protein NapF [Oceanospirillaceae bacterium]